jgi:internalin A
MSEWREAASRIEQAGADARELKLTNLGLTKLPRSLIDLTALRKLDLSGNRLTEVPAEVLALRELKMLRLRANHIAELDADLAGLPLRDLDLSDNRLRVIQPAAIRIPTLRKLNVAGNHAIALPDNLGEAMPDLTALNLGGTGTPRLPPSFPKLRRLQDLRLNDAASARRFLPVVCTLTSLRILDLRNCRLADLPLEIADLAMLEKLYVGDNQLRSLPPGLAQLHRLRVLDVSNNRLNIPPEIAALTDARSILANIHSARRLPLNEAKLLLVGEAGVGKTSLSRRLRHGVFRSDETMTEGIEISDWRVELTEGRSVQANIWDFGGQEILHATHQFFLTKRALYVLILNCRHSDDQNRIEPWLKVIESLGAAPPTVIVGAHSDERPLEVDELGLKQKYPFIRAFAQISNRTGAGIDNLDGLLRREIGRLAHVNDAISAEWFAVKRAVSVQSAERDFLHRNEYEDICREHGVIAESEQRNLLVVLNDLGTVVNFEDDPRLEDTTILNPRWVTEGVYRVLNSPQLRDGRGVLTQEKLAEIFWGDAKYPPAKQQFIIDIMRRFELCFPFDELHERFLVPDLLPKTQPYTGDWSDAMRFEVRYDALPSSVFSRLLVRLHHLVPSETYWRHGMVLRFARALALIRADGEDRKLTIDILGEGQRELLAIARQHLAVIHASFPGLEAEEWVAVDVQRRSYVPYAYLLELEALGKEKFVAPGLQQELDLADLLDTIELASVRRSHDPDITAHTSVDIGATRRGPSALEVMSEASGASIRSMTAIFLVVLAADVGASLLLPGTTAVAVISASTLVVALIGVLRLVASGMISEAGFLEALRSLLLLRPTGRDRREGEGDET